MYASTQSCATGSRSAREGAGKRWPQQKTNSSPILSRYNNIYYDDDWTSPRSPDTGARGRDFIPIKYVLTRPSVRIDRNVGRIFKRSRLMCLEWMYEGTVKDRFEWIIIIKKKIIMDNTRELLRLQHDLINNLRNNATNWNGHWFLQISRWNTGRLYETALVVSNGEGNLNTIWRQSIIIICY